MQKTQSKTAAAVDLKVGTARRPRPRQLGPLALAGLFLGGMAVVSTMAGPSEEGTGTGPREGKLYWHNVRDNVVRCWFIYNETLYERELEIHQDESGDPHIDLMCEMESRYVVCANSASDFGEHLALFMSRIAVNKSMDDPERSALKASLEQDAHRYAESLYKSRGFFTRTLPYGELGRKTQLMVQRRGNEFTMRIRMPEHGEGGISRTIEFGEKGSVVARGPTVFGGNDGGGIRWLRDNCTPEMLRGWGHALANSNFKRNDKEPPGHLTQVFEQIADLWVEAITTHPDWVKHNEVKP